MVLNMKVMKCEMRRQSYLFQCISVLYLSKSLFPSIHLFYAAYLGPGPRWQQSKQGSTDFPLPSNVFQLLLGRSQAR